MGTTTVNAFISRRALTIRWRRFANTVPFVDGGTEFPESSAAMARSMLAVKINRRVNPAHSGRLFVNGVLKMSLVQAYSTLISGSSSHGFEAIRNRAEPRSGKPRGL